MQVQKLPHHHYRVSCRLVLGSQAINISILIGLDKMIQSMSTF